MIDYIIAGGLGWILGVFSGFFILAIFTANKMGGVTYDEEESIY